MQTLPSGYQPRALHLREPAGLQTRWPRDFEDL
jgi:hypothetical protein